MQSLSEIVVARGRTVAHDRLLAVHANLNGEKGYWLIVDTGATDVALLPVVIDQLRLSRLPTAIEQYSVGQSTATQAPVYRLDNLAVEGLGVEGLEVVPLDWPQQWGVPGILGMSYLSAFPRFCLDLVTLTLELHLHE